MNLNKGKCLLSVCRRQPCQYSAGEYSASACKALIITEWNWGQWEFCHWLSLV